MNKTLFNGNFDEARQRFARSLLQRLDTKYGPAFERLTEDERYGVALYFLPHSSAKETLSVARPRVGKLTLLMQKFKRIYEHLALNRPLDFRGGSWRLPHELSRSIILSPLLQLCQEAGIPTKNCKDNLITTP